MARTRTPPHPTLDALVEEHLDLADGIARRYAHRGVEVDDLEQVARLALVLAARRYKPWVGVPFAAFAAPTIRGELKRYFRDHGWVVRPPRRVQELGALARATRGDLEQQWGHAPSVAEVAECLQVARADLEECDAASTGFHPLSLDENPAHEVPLAERLEAPASDLEALADVISLRRELGRLTERERRVVTWRFDEGLTQGQIADLLGVSQMQVSRILARIMAQLRLALSPVEAQAC